MTVKQEAFVRGLVEGKSQRDAYRDAYNCTEATDRTVDNKASKLFARAEVRARYDALMGEVRAKADGETIATAAQVLEELTAMAFGTKTYPGLDMFGNPVERPVSVTQRLKALELLGRKHKLFTDNVAVDSEGALEVKLRVIR
ncbi:hypothetical protein H8S23_05120 [Anaerofilum sp. BX8]|uniref:Terminase small subunit n=1 Tax=Anaerofilum hominis TaxID=2763016 RepID=A0A923I5V6_9FIRM|nr:terminase small subunit [Anaerofilum hominis]MBC5580878.1 hypothetical protein [Anaerofilum hominis]